MTLCHLIFLDRVNVYDFEIILEMSLFKSILRQILDLFSVLYKAKSDIC